MFKLKIAPRLMFLFLFVSLVPLLLINFYWFQFSQKTLRNNAASRQTLLTTTAADRVDQYITDKVNLLIIHSQVDSVQSFNLPGVQQDFRTLINQDKDIFDITLADSAGNERAAISRDNTKVIRGNIGSSDAFRAATFLSGKEYISPVAYSVSGEPYITIAVPLVKYDSAQILTNLSTAEPGLIRDQNAIKGVLVARVDLSQIWQSVLSAKVGANGYTYLVDSQGQLIAHPDRQFMASHRNISKTPVVASFLKDPTARADPATVLSERGVPVISTHQLVTRTNWGVVAQEPVASIFSASKTIERAATVLFVLVAIVVIVMSYIFSKRITGPIKRLAAGASQISQGNLMTRIHLKRRDEIGALGTSFNAMAESLSDLLSRVTVESNKLNVILNNASEGVVAIDAQDKIVVANTPAGILKNTVSKDLVGKTFGEIYAWQKDDKPVTFQYEVAKVYGDLQLIDHKGRLRYFDVLTNPILNDVNGIKAIITMVDKTESRELENMKLDFVSMAAHELRTPLTAIKGYIDLISHDASSSFSQQTIQFLGRLKYSSAQSVGLINNLLNVSKIERGALSLGYEKIDWKELVQNALADEQMPAKIKNINLVFHAPEGEVAVLADRYAISEVVNNLVSNAIKYTPDGGTVTVSIQVDAGKVLTSIQDTGIGISPSAIEHLFTKFYRVNGGLASGSGGTGLGLYISKSIIELHKGEISVTSEEGKGSNFYFTIPVFDQIAYDILKNSGQIKERNKHGWSTKNITR